METIVTGSVMITDVLIYAGITLILLSVFDMYAARKMGKESDGFKVLRMPKFWCLAAASVYSIALLGANLAGVSISYKLETFLGLPYFAIWCYYMITTMHRVKAETGHF